MAMSTKGCEKRELVNRRAFIEVTVCGSLGLGLCGAACQISGGIIGHSGGDSARGDLEEAPGDMMSGDRRLAGDELPVGDQLPTGDRLPAGDDPIGDSAQGPDLGGQYLVDADKCTGCAKCVAQCTPGAFTLLGNCEVSLVDQPCARQCFLPCVPACTAGAIVTSSVDPIHHTEIDLEKCNCCGDCVTVCPYDIIVRVSDRLAVIDEQICTRCGDCILPGFCPPEAIDFA